MLILRLSFFLFFYNETIQKNRVEDSLYNSKAFHFGHLTKCVRACLTVQVYEDRSISALPVID